MIPFEVHINNRKVFLLPEIPKYHPESSNYLTFWREQKRRCIEGFWAQDTKNTEDKGSWRYMPPQLYFYANFGTILHKKEGSPKTAPRVKVKPNLDDIDWEFFYAWLVARGFSGFEGDDLYTCCRDVLDYENGNSDAEIPTTAYNKRGKLKKYIDAKEYLIGLHSKNYGRPLYDNTALNLMVLGTRGGGKSYWVAQGCILHEVLFDGLKYYDLNLDILPTAEICAGSAIAAKSSEMLQKTQMGMDNLPGVWKKGTPDEVPAPFYRKMAGTLAPNNVKNPWKFENEKKINGEWKKVGSGSNVKHVVYTTENPEAAAGGRYSVTVVEEVGLTQNLLTIHGSNDATMRIEHKFGSAIYLGTGGNIEKIVESEIVFRDPDGYEMVAFDDHWENSGKIGLFIPAYRGDRKFKDSEGNTKVEEALKYYESRREAKRKAKSSSALELEQMNYPQKPSEMFLNKSVNKFSVRDAKARYSELISSGILDESYKGFFDIIDDKVTWKSTTDTPIREYPLTSTTNIEGCIEIFKLPTKDASGNVNGDRYAASLDPIDDDDNQDVSRSLQSFWIMDLWTDELVLEYTARTKLAKEFYEQCRRALLFFNARLLYENQKKGCYQYFETKTSTYLLADTPTYLKDIDMQKISSVGNRSKGVYMTDGLKPYGIDLFVEYTDSKIHPDSETTRMMTIKSPALLREIMLYSKGRNTDRLSSLIILMIYRESKIKYIESSRTPIKTINDDPFFDKMYQKKAMFRYGQNKGNYLPNNTGRNNFAALLKNT